jgi:hypothetical protein
LQKKSRVLDYDKHLLVKLRIIDSKEKSAKQTIKCLQDNGFDCIELLDGYQRNEVAAIKWFFEQKLNRMADIKDQILKPNHNEIIQLIAGWNSSEWNILIQTAIEKTFG